MTIPIIAPQFLISHIELIAFVMAVMLLVIFDEFVSMKIIFPFADFIKKSLFSKASSIKQARKHKKPVKYFTEFLATAIFIFYCYMGYFILGRYFIAPILYRLQNIILIIVVAIFLLVSYVFNNRRLRKKFLIG